LANIAQKPTKRKTLFKGLFLGLNMRGRFFTPFTKLFEFNLSLNSLPVFPAPVIDSFASLTG